MKIPFPISFLLFLPAVVSSSSIKTKSAKKERALQDHVFGRNAAAGKRGRMLSVSHKAQKSAKAGKHRMLSVSSKAGKEISAEARKMR
eukprot:scaffold18198_cov134-Skeletonema_dohrnii-CCMP3373.AAC.4